MNATHFSGEVVEVDMITNWSELWDFGVQQNPDSMWVHGQCCHPGGERYNALFERDSLNRTIRVVHVSHFLYKAITSVWVEQFTHGSISPHSWRRIMSELNRATGAPTGIGIKNA